MSPDLPPPGAPSAASDPLGRLGAQLLALHRLAAAAPVEQFQERALAVVEALVPFDSGFWGTGAHTERGAVIHAVHLCRQPPEMIASYERVKQHDLLSELGFTNQGVTQNAEVGVPPFTPHPAIVAHTERFGMTHALSTVVADGEVGLYTALAIYRADRARRFSEEERLLMQALMPHLVETWTIARLHAVEGRPPGRPDRSRALCDRLGVLHAAAPGFAPLLRAEWPGWRGPTVPEPLRAEGLPARGRHVGKAVVVRSAPSGQLRLLQVRRVAALDALTPREREVVGRFGAGASYQAIAADLEMAPATVRNHLQAAYAKLGVGNKAALAHLLRDAED